MNGSILFRDQASLAKEGFSVSFRYLIAASRNDLFGLMP